MKKQIALILALALMLGCTAAMADKIGFTCMDGTNSFFIAVEAAVREIVEAKGDELISMDPKNSNEKQIAQIEEMIADEVAAVFINPVDQNGITDGLNKLKEAFIPVFGIETVDADMNDVTNYVESDIFNAGKVCGKDLAARLPGGGPVIVLDSPAIPSVAERTEGFLDAIYYTDFTVVCQKDCLGSQEQGKLNAADALSAYPDAVAIFCGNDAIALGAVAAAEAAHSKALIYSVGGSPEIKALIAEGKVTGAGAQSPISVGRAIAELYYQWNSDDDDIDAVEFGKQVETFMINSDNIAEYNDGGWQ